MNTLLRMLAASLLAWSGWLAAEAPGSDITRQVMETEQAFAATMADRDYPAFTSFLSDEAIFFDGDTPLRGKQQVSDTWKPYFEGDQAPFSWQPQTVEVLESGRLALSTGPVRNPQGEVVATFTSIWRREPGGEWKIIFDKGNRVCGD